MAKITITDLCVRTIIGTNGWERENLQDILINIVFSYDSRKAAKSDNIKDAVDYKKITKQIIREVELSHYFLLEALVEHVLKIVMAHPAVAEAMVRIDKPHALRFAKSVALELHRKR